MRSILVMILCATSAFAQAPPRQRPAPPPADSIAEPGRPGWTVDVASGCWLWNADPLADETVTWTGACPRGPANGHGTEEWRWAENEQPRLDRYVGTLREGRMEGRGTRHFPSGDRYDGEYRNDRQNGRGTYIWASGNRYEGGWRDSRQHGRGTLTLSNGARYDGEWRNGLRHGRGTFIWPEGNRYEGEYRDNRPDGYGEYYSVQTGWFRGQWSAGCFRGQAGRAAINRPIAECR